MRWFVVLLYEVAVTYYLFSDFVATGVINLFFHIFSHYCIVSGSVITILLH